MAMSSNDMEKTLQFLLSLLPEESLAMYDNMMLSDDTPIAADSKPGTDAANPSWMKMSARQRNILRALDGHKRGLPVNHIALDAAVAGRHGKRLLSTIPGFKDENAFPDFDTVMNREKAPTFGDDGKLV